MRVVTAVRVSVYLAFFLLAGCAWVVDQAAGFPASDLISDVKNTSDDIKEEKHEERVEELNREYEEFLRSREAADDDQETAEQSIIINRDRDQNE